MDKQQFAQQIKQKYPQYASINDDVLVDSILKKYPQYQSKIKEPVGSETAQDFLNVGQDILQSATKRAENISELEAKKQEDERSAIGTTLKQTGQALGAGADAIGAVVEGGLKLLLPQTAEDKLKEIADNLGEAVAQNPKVQKLAQRYADADPKTQEAIDAIGGVVALASEFVGAGVAKRGANVAVDVTQQGLKNTGKVIGDVATQTAKNISNVAGDVVPSRTRITNQQVTRALDLTQGDVKNINLSTNNEVGNWLSENNLIRNNVDETRSAVKELGDTSYEQVRQEIAKVPLKYSKLDVPRYEQALQQIIKQTDTVPGLEDVSSEAKSLLKKKNVNLSDVQRVKELMDEQFSLYKVTGDVKESTQKEGLAKIRTEIKEFIEKEVQTNSGQDIRKLNNNVATARTLEQAIEERSTRGLTRSNIKLGDLGVFGAASAIGSPLAGAVAVVAKKIIETPTIRLRFAKWLNSLSDRKKQAIAKQLTEGKVPKDVEKIVNAND